MTSILLLSLGAVVGAIGRVSAESLLQREGEGYPWGTFLVNVAGALVLGAVAAAVRDGAIDDSVLVLVGAGFTGALTTFSGFAYRVDQEIRSRRIGLGLAYTASTLVVGIAAAAIGFGLAS
jgi:CrcB protein